IMEADEALRIGDRREKTLEGSGLLRVWDQEAGEERIVDLGRRDAQERFAANVRRRDEELESMFRRCGVDYVDIDTGSDYVMPLSRFFRARAKRR
ncbi:MAG: DUF58 domain-containing protein, partial [Candidatus Krumholzibacteriota bacterium]|nr:DUF58 domain-containing protein [Candidatus Krumholzibacteriota bacterium]